MKKTKSLVLALCLFALVTAMLSGCTPAQKGAAPQQGSVQTQQTEQALTVSDLAVKTMPVKTEYLIGEVFSSEGAVLAATYSDGSVKDININDPGVVVTAPSNDNVGNKNVLIRYEGARTSFQISVVKESIGVTLRYNADGMTDETISVDKGDPLPQPTPPERKGYAFAGWFTDAQGTIAYDFDQTVEQPLMLYAIWVDQQAKNYEFTFDLNQSDLEKPTIVQQVQENQPAVRLSEDPERFGYEFTGWFTEAEGGAEYDFGTPVTAPMSVFAHWTRAVTGEQTYVFEAEDTNLAGKSGPAFSGTAMETGMIVFDKKHGASNDRFVGYLYQRYNSIEFFINSDEVVENVTFVARLSAEMRDYTFNMNNFMISVNGESMDYGDIMFVNVPENSYNSIEALPFEDYTISTDVKLKKGMNVFTFMTDNEDKMEGSTLLAAAPIIDCIKLTTSAVLTWSQTMGLPADNY